MLYTITVLFNCLVIYIQLQLTYFTPFISQALCQYTYLTNQINFPYVHDTHELCSNGRFFSSNQFIPLVRPWSWVSCKKIYICNSYFIRTCLCPNIHTQLPIAVAFVLSYFMPRHAVCNLHMRAGMVLAVVAFHWTIWWSINRLMWI